LALENKATFWGDEPATLLAVAEPVEADPTEMWIWV
jgi:hypothetical protein